MRAAPAYLLAALAIAASAWMPRGAHAQGALEPRMRQADGVWGVEIFDGDRVIGAADPAAPAGLEVMLPGESAFRPVEFRERKLDGAIAVLGPASAGGLSLSLEFEPIGAGLLRRTLVAHAREASQFCARWSLSIPGPASFRTFTREETQRVLADSIGGGPEYPEIRGEAIPAAMALGGGRVDGLLGDTAGRWENRRLVELDPAAGRLAILCGDGRAPRELRIVHDARDQYSGMIDGWQSLAAGETRRFDTWVFSSPALSHYDAQLAAHLALANAKGWNGSALEAILRNTAYLNLRRNLLRADKEPGRFIFISGIGYGWKQWVSDGFWQAVACEDPEMLAEAHASVFMNRITYEDNAQYYLIWAALANRAGRAPDMKVAREAYDFIRAHEKDGVFYPPPLPGAPSAKGWKTYHDLLEYDDDDAPVSNQGFHCGALMAAREIGLPATQADIARAIAGYRRMFFAEGGYFPTSLKQTQHVGQDTLYGAALTYAVFGEKTLEDEQVAAHWRYSQRIASPYGLRVISLADGALLPGHAGVYVHGGSWFLNDSANHLMAALHGVPDAEADAALVKRIEAELAFAPAFNESISTVSGAPHGHINYSWNSGYWWLRKQFRARRGQTGPDPVETEIDRKLGVIRGPYGLRLDPARATLRPEAQP